MANKTLYGELSPGLVAYYVPPSSKSLLSGKGSINHRGPTDDIFPGGVIDLVDWVVWIDSDAVIVNHDIKFGMFGDMVPLHNFVGISAPAMWDPSCTRINTGIWMMRRGDWAKKFMQAWWDCGELPEQRALKQQHPWEQPCLNTFLYSSSPLN